jgi:peptidoglycan hydrolase CwlO-like protein
MYKSLDAPAQDYPDHKLDALTNNAHNFAEDNEIHPHVKEINSKYNELNEAKAKIEELESRIAYLENHIPKKYPDVKFQNYKNRKRILVSDLNYKLK